MEYMFLPEASRLLNIPVRLLKDLCYAQKIDGAVRFGQIWALPTGTAIPHTEVIRMSAAVRA